MEKHPDQYRDKIERRLDEFFHKNYFYNHCEKHGFVLKVGEIKEKKGYFIVEILGKTDEAQIPLENILIDKDMGFNEKSITTTYLVSMFKSEMDRYKEYIQQEKVKQFQSAVREGKVPIGEVNNCLERMAKRLAKLPKGFAEKYTLDTDLIGLDIISEMGLLYSEKLDDRYNELAYYCTTMLNDIRKAKQLHKRIDDLHRDEELYSGKIDINISIPRGGILNRVEAEYEKSSFIDYCLWENLEQISTELDCRVSELKLLLSDQ